MEEYQKQFIQFMVENEALCFGSFTLKSGRIAPYFINSGKYRTGKQIARLGEFYAQCYLDNRVNAEILVGPAYKGIPLAVSTAIALSNNHGVNVGFCFDRKEAKDHGEGGMFVGEKLNDGSKIAIIEDVMTSGKALKEILPKIKQEANVVAEDMIISVDRCEKGAGDKSAAREALETYGIRVHSIVTIYNVIEAIETGVIGGKEYLRAMKDYLKTYGA